MAEIEAPPLMQSGVDPFHDAALARASDPVAQQAAANILIDYATRFARVLPQVLADGYEPGYVADAVTNLRVQYDRQVERILRERGGTAADHGFGTILPRGRGD